MRISPPPTAITPATPSGHSNCFKLHENDFAGSLAIDRIPGKHFPQEDQAPAIATRVASIALARRVG
jgi:hypothetical protein